MLFYEVDGEFTSTANNYDQISIDEVIGLNSANESYGVSGLIQSTILEATKYAEIGTNLGSISSRLSAFDTGDYVVVKGPFPHGFIIVGFAEAEKCEGSPDAGNSIINPSINVPWVVDLPGTQDGDPRPFYCTRIAEDFADNSTFFGFTWWHFIRVADLWLINFNRLYPDPLPSP